MSTSYEVRCINKSDRHNEHERILYIGGMSGGERWTVSQAGAITGIEKGEWAFYVKNNGQKVNVIIGCSALGNKYLRTEPDGTNSNNLLSLPECP